jgi:peptidoglycan hydrolase-like protein with peptidoglycan-binding domain
MAEFEHQSEKFGYINLDSLGGAQQALTHLGYDPGAADGLDGPRTQKAVKAFQTSASIRVDGIVGPETRGALRDALENVAHGGTQAGKFVEGGGSNA